MAPTHMLSLLCPDLVCPFERGKWVRMKNNHGLKQRQSWGVLGALWWYQRWKTKVSCSLSTRILPSAAPCQTKEVFEEEVAEVGWDTSSGICGYVISAYRTHKMHGTRLASASRNPLLFQVAKAHAYTLPELIMKLVCPGFAGKANKLNT